MAFKLKKVLISEPVDARCGKILSDHGIEVVTKVGLSKEQLLDEIQHYDGLVVRSATKVTEDVISAGRNLTVIGRAGTGFDNIDCDAATRCGVLVLNAPGGNTLSAAELTCCMIASLSRNLAQACASLKSGKWDRKKFMGNELNGKVLAIVGLGRIGREVASRMQSYGMKTIGFDPLVPAEESIKFGVQSYNLDDLWPLADYITLHVPLIRQTKDFINDEILSKCKKGVKIVNCARGGIINEDALVRALESGQCSGAGLDVYSEEPPKDTGLIQHPNVICTPHLGANTVEAQTRVAEEIAEQFVDLVNGKSVLGVVNSPAFCASLAQENLAIVSLCQSLGAIIGAFGTDTENGLSFTIGVKCENLAKKQNLLKVAVLVGLLKQIGNQDANFVNAPVFAEEAKIQVISVSNISTGEGLPDTTVVVTANKGGEYHNVMGMVHAGEAYLSAIDGAGFNSPVKLTGSIAICGGDHGAKMTVDLIGSFIESGAVYNASWSSVYNGKSWCVIQGDISEVPASAKSMLDFYALLSI